MFRDPRQFSVMAKNIKFIISCLSVFTLVSCSSGPGSSGDVIEGTSEVVKKNTDYYGVGYVIGKPIKSSKRGLIFKTNEVEINVGAFGGDLIGITDTFSIEKDDLARQFDQLDRNTLYVFKFEYPHRLNPEIEDTHYHIRSWEKMNPNVQFKHRGVESYREKKGGYSSGIRQGKVISVHRWGYWDIDCSVRILMGGFKTTGVAKNTSTTENVTKMNTYSEEACAFAEKALKAGVYVAFEYSEDYVEIWDRTAHILHKISIVDTKP